VKETPIANPAKQARAAHPIHPFVAGRWSPYAWSRRPVPREDLVSVFEAARWAPSSFNEQPWRYLVATRDDPAAFDAMLSCLVEGNREWARHAPVLALALVSEKYARNDKPNKVALHDLGLASATLTLEAVSRGLAVHQMGGILPDRIREVYGVPDDMRPVTALAIGYPAGDGESVPEAFRERDARPRSRRPLSETVFSGTWGQAAW